MLAERLACGQRACSAQVIAGDGHLGAGKQAPVAWAEAAQADIDLADVFAAPRQKYLVLLASREFFQIERVDRDFCAFGVFRNLLEQKSFDQRGGRVAFALGEAWAANE